MNIHSSIKFSTLHLQLKPVQSSSQSSVMGEAPLMETLSPKDKSAASSPLSSPNIGALLKIKILSWSQETGQPASARVRVADRTFNLHKLPLSSKSRYFKRRLDESEEIELPANFPGGLETFETIILFVYSSSTLIDPFNVASLRCAAEFLEMTEDYSSSGNNLCERFDLYLNQVVLQNWDDTLIVLQKCRTLLPWAEDLLIVSRCIESLAFMACMEILDPERRRDQPMITLEMLKNRPWSCEIAKEIVGQELWIKDLIALPFRFFKRVVGSLRRQGMKEKYVSPIVVFYANKWVIMKKTAKTSNDLGILDGLLDLLLVGEKATREIPVGFYLALLSKSPDLGIKPGAKSKLRNQIASMLPNARLDDLVSSSIELATMEKIVSRYVTLSNETDTGRTPLTSNSVVAEMWDAYLCKVATDREIGPTRLVKLIETVPISYRQSHDNLYRTLNIFLQAHPEVSQEEKGAVCKYLSCQKLSQEVCIEAVQNELMPLRLIVQALFVQQLNTQQAFKQCSDSFRYNHLELSGSLSGSRCPLNLAESPYIEEQEYESTSFRIKTLEQELMSLKRSLHLQSGGSKRADPGPVRFRQKSKKADGSDGQSMSKRKNGVVHMTTGCIGSMNFASQRRYASRLMKIFRRISLFGSRNLKKQPTNSI